MSFLTLRLAALYVTVLGVVSGSSSGADRGCKDRKAPNVPTRHPKVISPEFFDVEDAVGLRIDDIHRDGIRGFGTKKNNKLKVLKIFGSASILIPDNIDNLTELKELRVPYNPNDARFFDKLAKAPKLKCLHLDNSARAENIGGISKLKNLEKLCVTDLGHVSRVRGFREIPRDIFRITSLRRLSLEGNRISRIPKDLFMMDNLEFVDISLNCVEEIDFGERENYRLKTLDLGDNYISKIGPGISKLKGLRTLCLRYNEIRRLPRTILELPVRDLVLQITANEFVADDTDDEIGLDTLRKVFGEDLGKGPWIEVVLERFLEQCSVILERSSLRCSVM